MAFRNKSRFRRNTRSVRSILTGFQSSWWRRILADLGHAHGLRSIALRYFNAAGADPDGDIGEAHDPEPHLIPRVLAAARDGTVVTVYGDDYETADGTRSAIISMRRILPMRISARSTTSCPVA